MSTQSATAAHKQDNPPLHSKRVWLMMAGFALLPLVDWFLPPSFHTADVLRPVFIFSLLGIGLNVVTGFTGLLNLGVAGFMALGVYSYSITTCDIYPFQFGFFGGVLVSIFVGALSGLLIGLPTLRLRGDYLAVVTLGFGEIIQDSLKNLESITKGTQGINPVPSPSLFGYQLSSSTTVGWYYFLLGIVALTLLAVRNLETSRIGRSWMSIREDELAAQCMGVNPVKTKLLSFAVCAGLCALSGALWASYLGSSGEPSNYDFQISILALCMVIVGGLGSLSGVLLGALVMVGFNSVFLVKLTDFLAQHGLTSGDNVFSSPSNWKYFAFGLVLILMMRYRPDGLLPAARGRIRGERK